MVKALVAKNTTYLTVSSLLQKLLAFWWFAYVANQLGEELLGSYLYALTYTSIFVIIMNFGLIPVLTREGAKYKETLQEQFNLALSLKIVLTVMSLVVLFAVYYILQQVRELPPSTSLLVYLASIVIVFDTFRSIFLAVLRARQAMQYEAVGQFIYQVLVVGFGIAFFGLGYKAGGLIMAIIIASIFYMLFALVVMYKRAEIKLGWYWRWDQVKKLLLIAAPFALADIFFKLNGSIDTVMLQYLSGERYVAWYGIALKLTVTLTVIPGAFATAFFPSMSRAFAESKEDLRSIFEQFFIYILMLSAPIAVGAAITAPRIIALVYPTFPAATIALQIFMVGLIFLFANYPIGNLLNATNHQLLNTINMAIALVVNIVLNFFLIPSYTYIGATIAAVITAVVLVTLGFPRVYHEIHFNIALLMKRSLAILGSAATMGIIIWLAASWAPSTTIGFLIIAAIAVVVYGIMLVLLRALRWQDIAHLLQIVRKKIV
ncbi:MAG: lipopolysaccharide O-side chain biosynthesis protein (O-antigen transporter) [uncultured bacterium]|nr:MAG: lipopolysaccharide O-side chain biosynthesis protein (O-antigen transporter) [uncultured bacterium]